MASTLLLDRTSWDLVVDIYGNIAVADETYAITQDVASACRLFIAELWYDTSKGIPYFEQVLGHYPPLSLLKSYLERAAMTVPRVASARAFITLFEDRRVSGQVQVTLVQTQAEFVAGIPPQTLIVDLTLLVNPEDTPMIDPAGNRIHVT